MKPLRIGPTGLGTSAARIGGSRHQDATSGQPLGILRLRLQDITFGCPWPWRFSPFVEQARNHALSWMEEFGLTRDPDANAAQYRDWKLAEGAALTHPDATPEGLVLAADLWGWYFAPFDDQFDGELGRDPQRAAEFCADLLGVLHMADDAPLPSSEPVVAAFADIWRRSVQGMSESWRLRYAHHWKEYILGQLMEVVNRVHDRVPDVEGRLRNGHATSSLYVLYDLSERVTGYELPTEAWYAPILGELRKLATEIIVITNDLVSADRELASGDIANNLLLILESQGHSRPEAIDRMRQMSHERYARYQLLDPQVTELDDILPPQGRLALRRWLQAMHDYIAGDNQWEHISGRYRADDEHYLLVPKLRGGALEGRFLLSREEKRGGHLLADGGGGSCRCLGPGPRFRL